MIPIPVNGLIRHRPKLDADPTRSLCWAPADRGACERSSRPVQRAPPGTLQKGLNIIRNAMTTIPPRPNAASSRGRTFAMTLAVDPML